MEYRLSNLIDLQKIQHLMDILYQITKLSWAMIDIDGTILARSPWSELCTGFHRANPKTETRCNQSDAYIKQRAAGKREIVSYKCANGLEDMAAPIVIGEDFLGAIYVGQFFYEEPNVDFFRTQALEFGFDEFAYLKALAAVPVIPREKIEPIVHFFLQFAESIIDMGLKQVHLLEAEKTLRESEERFRAVANYTYDWEAWIGPDGKPIWVNPAVERITGYSVEECLSMQDYPFPLVHEADRERIKSVLSHAIQGSIGEDIEFRIQRKDGRETWVAVSWQPIYDLGGISLGIRASLRDITERKRDEQELRLHRDHLEELVKQRTEELALLNQIVYGSLEASDVGAFWIDFREEDTYHALDNTAKMLGLTPVKGRSYRRSEWTQVLINTKTVLPEYADTIDEALEQFSGALSNRYKNYRAIHPIVMPDSSVKWLDARADVPLRDEQGKALLMTGTVIDITKRRRIEEELIAAREAAETGVQELKVEIRERKKVEENLQKSEEHFRFLVQQVKDYSIIYLDTEGRIVSWNEGAERIHGYRQEEVVGKHFSLFYPKEAIERGDTRRILEITTVEGQFKEEGWRVRKDGSRFWSDVVITALRDEIGALKGFTSVARDITERRNIEEAINYRLGMEELVVTISNRFINISSEELDNEINHALGVVKNFTDADRCYLCLLSNDGFTVAQFYESLSSKIASRGGGLQGLSLESFPWIFDKFKRGEEVCVFDITDLPPEAAVEKEYWRTHSTVQALVAIPLILGQELLGYLAVNSDQKGKRWAPEDVRLLRLVGEIFANALERKKAEKRRTELEMEILEGQRRELDLRRAENERWIDLGQMASGIAHDIRNPINYVSLALDHISGKEQAGKTKGIKTRKLIENAHSELVRVNDMVQGLLEYGRTQTPLLELENAFQILAESVKEALRHHPEGITRIRLEGIEESFPIYVQRDLLLRCLINLIENALEAGGPNVEVRAGVNYNPKKKDEIVLWIQDSGAGILEENLQKIFTPFFTTKKSGIGLGLTLVRKWVGEMRGQIKVSNVPEGGARFEILFPVKSSQIESKG